MLLLGLRGRPLGGHWTLCLYLRADRLVNDYGDLLGGGPMTLLSSPAVGLTITLPSGGAVPLAALRSQGGPLTGAGSVPGGTHRSRMVWPTVCHGTSPSWDSGGSCASATTHPRAPSWWTAL